jgi:glucosyl-3-phosphoglycerate phosphatase
VTRLILWRHGRTAWNAQGRVQGQLDIPMDNLGRVQAVLAAVQLAGRRPSLIVSSDLRRACQTAAELALLTGQEVVLDSRLRERAYGEWQGQTLDEIAARWPAAAARWRAGEPVNEAGVESVDDVTKRVAEALRDAVERAPDGVVIASTHGGAARRGLVALLGWPDDVLRTLGVLSNCHWSELGYDEIRGWRLFSHNVGPAAEPVGAT